MNIPKKRRQPKTIGIVGTRRRDTAKDYQLTLKTFLDNYQKGDMIVSGGCPKGGDSFAEMIADYYDIPIKIHKAEWGRYGKSAGFKRNVYIAQDCDILIAVVADDRKGGTEHTIREAEKLERSIILI